MKLRRVGDDGVVTESDIEGLDLGSGKITFRVDADVEVGDQVSIVLPIGKTRTMRLDHIEVRQSAFGNRLDHTESSYTVINQKAALQQPAPVTLPGLRPANLRCERIAGCQPPLRRGGIQRIQGC
jgi:hypothetical protein